MSTIGHEHETIRVEQMKTTLQAYLDRFGGGSGYTKSEADAKFLTITAFENLFNAIGSDGTTKISHPYASGVASIKAMVGLWTEQYLSALGQNSGGGGGGGSSTLAGLNDVSLSNPSNGQILQYNGTQWVNANAPQTGVTSVAAGTGLTTNITGGGAITSTGTISLSSATQTDIAKGVTAYGWGNHALAGYAQNSALNNYLPLTGGTMTGKLRLLTGSDVGIEASDYAGLLVYKPESGWTGVSNTQWAVGALSAQGVIRSNDNSLLHYNGTNNYKIWDEGNDGSGSGLDADLLDGIHAKDMLIHYQLPRNVTASTYWHKLGEYVTGGDNSNLILEVYSGSGYNANGSQNSWAKIIIKDGWQSQTSETNSVGVSVEEYGYYSTGIKVIVVATAHNKGAVWVQLPWQYAVGDYVVYGRYKSWTHNDSTTTDTTTAPTSNQNPVYYYRNLSYMNGAGEQAVTLPHNMSVKAGMDGAQLRIGNMLLTYDATNKALKIEHQGSNGVESGNFYATGAVSALGANTSGGGGGGGSSTLADLLDVTLSSPSNGQVLTYDSAIGKWINATIPTPSMEGYATQNWVQQNYATLAAISDMATQTWVGQQGFLTSSDISDMATKTWVGQQGYLTSSAISDMATKTWVGQQGFLTSSDISDMATKTWVGQQGYLTSSAISDMATKTWVGQQGFVTSSAISDMATKTWVGQNYLGINATAAAATKLATARYLWGQSFDGTDNVSGSISAGSNGGSILQFHSIELNSAGTLANYGGFIDFHFNGSAADYTSRIIEDAVGVLSINAKDATSPYNYRKAGLRIGDGVNESFLQIGNVRLIYDQTNNALKVEKYDGTTANFYATGGVSALGVPTAGSGTVDTLNVNTLKAISNLYIGDNNTRIYYDYNDDALTLQSGSGDISFKGTLTMDGSTTSQRHINTRGGNVYLGSGYLYLSSSVYLYTDGSNVKVNINGTTYTLTKS